MPSTVCTNCGAKIGAWGRFRGSTLCVRCSGEKDLRARVEDALRSSGLDTTQVVVAGLVSVASIARFKRVLDTLPGVRGVRVSSTTTGEFKFTVRHDPGTSLAALIPTMPWCQPPEVTAPGEGDVGSAATVVRVTVRDPEGTRLPPFVRLGEPDDQEYAQTLARFERRSVLLLVVVGVVLAVAAAVGVIIFAVSLTHLTSSTSTPATAPDRSQESMLFSIAGALIGVALVSWSLWQWRPSISNPRARRLLAGSIALAVALVGSLAVPGRIPEGPAWPIVVLFPLAALAMFLLTLLAWWRTRKRSPEVDRFWVTTLCFFIAITDITAFLWRSF